MKATILKFGEGKIGVSAGLQAPDVNTLVGMCFMEHGLGSGEIGGDVPDRPAGKPLFPDDVDGVILEFANRASIDVVIEQLQQLKTDWITAESSPEKRAELFAASEEAITAHKVIDA